MRKRWKVPLLALATVMVAGGIYLAELQETGNFHEVIPGELYRSAQPTAERSATMRRATAFAPC